MGNRQLIPVATTSDLLAWVLRRRHRLRVEGPSMEPTLSAGDVVFVDPNAYASGRPDDGDVVVATHPQQPTLRIVKRVEFTDDAGVYLVSDNSSATDVADSRRFGLVPFELIIGRVTASAAAQK